MRKGFIRKKTALSDLLVLVREGFDVLHLDAFRRSYVSRVERWLCRCVAFSSFYFVSSSSSSSSSPPLPPLPIPLLERPHRRGLPASSPPPPDLPEPRRVHVPPSRLGIDVLGDSPRDGAEDGALLLRLLLAGGVAGGVAGGAGSRRAVAFADGADVDPPDAVGGEPAGEVAGEDLARREEGERKERGRREKGESETRELDTRASGEEEAF